MKTDGEQLEAAKEGLRAILEAAKPKRKRRTEMKLILKQRDDIVSAFKAGASVPYLAALYKVSQGQIESTIRLRLLEHEFVDCVKPKASGAKYRVSRRDANMFLKLVSNANNK